MMYKGFLEGEVEGVCEDWMRFLDTGSRWTLDLWCGLDPAGNGTKARICMRWVLLLCLRGLFLCLLDRRVFVLSHAWLYGISLALEFGMRSAGRREPLAALSGFSSLCILRHGSER